MGAHQPHLAVLVAAIALRVSLAMADDEIPKELKTANYRITKLEGIGCDPRFGRQDPSNVIKVGGAYHVYTSKFTGSTPYTGVIGHATSTDGIHWEEQDDALSKGPADAWDNYGVLTPYIMAYNDRYYLYYTSSRKRTGESWAIRGPHNRRHIGLAIADSPNGPWQKLPQPVLSPSRQGEWDSYLVDDAHVIVREGKSWLYYKGGDIHVTADTTAWGLAVGDSPTGPFAKAKENPLIGGHTVCVWPHRDGVAALVDNAGPEKFTVQWSEDGIHFQRAARLEYVHTGCGPYDPDAFSNTANGRGITWGVAQDQQQGKMCIVRFDVDLEVPRNEPFPEAVDSQAKDIEQNDFQELGVAMSCDLPIAKSTQAGDTCQSAFDVVKPEVSDKLCRVTLDQGELGGELDRRIQNLIYQNYMVVDLDGKWLNYFRDRTDRGDRSHVYYGIGKVFDAGSLFAAYTRDPQVASRTQYIIDELVKSRDADGYIGFWNVEPENRQDHINWILHEQEYINLALVRNYRCTGNRQSLSHARIMGDYILRTFPTPQNPCYDAGQICTAGLPEGMLELYRVTGDRRYLDFAADVPHGNNRGEIQLASLRTWEQDFSRRPCHVYVMLARCYAQTELYRLTGEKHLLNMSQFMRNELLKQGEGGLLVTGSCSAGEHFTYNQNGRRAIGESCVTAYVLRWIDSLMRLEGDMRYGDLLERTIYNALFAANSPDGRWIRYFTPFTGDRHYDTRDCFCCCGNYRRAVAELPQKVYYRTPEGGVALNLFTNSKKAFDVNGQTVTIVQETAYPNDGNVRLTFSLQNPTRFAFQFRTPRWCEKIRLRVNDEAPQTIDPLKQKLGCYVLNRTWKNGDVVDISMPMDWRFVRGRAVQDGRVVLLRGPIVYCVGKDQNAELLREKCPEPRNLVIDPASIAEPIRDDSIRPGGLKVVARAWLNQNCTGETVDVTLTEFIDPSGQEVYFLVPNQADTSPVRLMDDELVSWPNEFASVHVLKAFYGPKVTGALEAVFEIRGDIVADLAADYVNPGGQTGLKAEFPDATGGSWAFYNCKNGGLLSTAAFGDIKPLNSQFKAFGSPLGYAYGLEDQGDQLGFVSNYAPSDRQEAAWRDHYTEKMFDQVLTVTGRNEFLYTHPISEPACYNVFRWTPSVDAQKKDVTLCGSLFSNLGNGVELRVIRWKDDTHHDILDTFNSKDLVVGKWGSAEFVLRLAGGQIGKHIDFVLHNAGSHICDATALKIRVYTNEQRTAAQVDVTDKVQAKYHNRLITPLGSYAELFGDTVPGVQETLKVKLHDWRDGVVKYLEFPRDSALDLTSK